MRHIFILSSFLLLGVVRQALGQGRDAILTIDEPLDKGVRRMEVEIEFSLGELSIERGNPDKAVTGFINYNEEFFRPTFSFKSTGDQAYFRLRTLTHNERWGFRDVVKWGGEEMKGPKGELYFTTEVPLDVNIDCGLASTQVDLGHLKVADFKLDNGLGKATVNFSTRNGTRLRRVCIDNGLGELVVQRISNARTDRLKIDCGLGAAEIDFSGEEYHDMDLDVNVGLGSVTIRVPEGYNVELEAEESFLSSISTDGLRKSGRNMYRSRHYDPRKPTLRINASIGLGSIDFDWID